MSPHKLGNSLYKYINRVRKLGLTRQAVKKCAIKYIDILLAVSIARLIENS